MSVSLSIVNHLMVILICYYWFCYVEAHLESSVVDKLALRLLTAIPLFVAIALTVSTVWTGWVFEQLPDGSISRGAMYTIVLVLSYGYALVGIVRLIAAAVCATAPAERRRLFMMSAFGIPPATVGLIDIFIPLLPIVAPAFFFSMLVIFTAMQEGQIWHDALTGLNNRLRAERYFDDELPHASIQNPFFYFVIDGNKFKDINDTYGHLEGDAALRTIAEAIKDACGDTNAHAARWGGDEFVVMGFADDVGNPEAFAQHVQNCLTSAHAKRQVAYPLSVSVGYASATDPNVSKQAVIEAADVMLYERKRVHQSR